MVTHMFWRPNRFCIWWSKLLYPQNAHWFQETSKYVKHVQVSPLSVLSQTLQSSMLHEFDFSYLNSEDVVYSIFPHLH